MMMLLREPTDRATSGGNLSFGNPAKQHQTSTPTFIIAVQISETDFGLENQFQKLGPGKGNAG